MVEGKLSWSECVIKYFVNNMGGLKLGEAIVRLGGMFFRSMNNSNYLLMNAEKLLNESFYIPKEYLIGFGENDIALEEDKVKFLIMGGIIIEHH